MAGEPVIGGKLRILFAIFLVVWVIVGIVIIAGGAVSIIALMNIASTIGKLSAGSLGGGVASGLGGSSGFGGFAP